MGNIFLSYRRDDSQGEALHLFNDLKQHFGTDRVFMDIAGIDPGKDFRTAIEGALSTCNVVITIIGKKWLSEADEAGTRRLDNPKDFVRLETVAALRRDIPLIPVLVQGAEMPRPEQLPEELEALAWRNACELRHNRWNTDVAELLRALEKIPNLGVRKHGGLSLKKSLIIIFIVISILAILVLVTMYKSQPDLQMGENYKKEDVLDNVPSLAENTEQFNRKTKIPINLHASYVWKHSNDFSRYVNENELEVRGVTGYKKAAGIILEEPISLNDATKLVVHVEGVEEENNRFSGKRLFWLIIDEITTQPINKISQNDADVSYVNARNGELVFPLNPSTLNRGQISKLEIVFYDAEINRLFLTMWLM